MFTLWEMNSVPCGPINKTSFFLLYWIKILHCVSLL